MTSVMNDRLRRDTVAVEPKVLKRGDDARFFVWLVVNGQYHPQIWYGDQLKGTGQFQRGAVGEEDKQGRGKLVACTPLPASDKRKIDELATDKMMWPDGLLLEDTKRLAALTLPPLGGSIPEGANDEIIGSDGLLNELPINPTGG